MKVATAQIQAIRLFSGRNLFSTTSVNATEPLLPFTVPLFPAVCVDAATVPPPVSLRSDRVKAPISPPPLGSALPNAVGKVMLVVCVPSTRTEEPREMGVPLAVTGEHPGARVVPARRSSLDAFRRRRRCEMVQR